MQTLIVLEINYTVHNHYKEIEERLLKISNLHHKKNTKKDMANRQRRNTGEVKGRKNR